MSDLNVAALVGRISQDAILRETAGGKKYCIFSVAVNRGRKKDDGTWEEAPHFFSLSLYEARAEKLAAYLVKGQTVSVQGHLVQDRWERDGITNSRMILAVDDLRLIGPAPEKKSSDKNAGAGTAAGDTPLGEIEGEETDPDLDIGIPDGEDGEFA
jgi:single-strand DNA-binding protein